MAASVLASERQIHRRDQVFCRVRSCSGRPRTLTDRIYTSHVGNDARTDRSARSSVSQATYSLNV